MCGPSCTRCRFVTGGGDEHEPVCPLRACGLERSSFPGPEFGSFDPELAAISGVPVALLEYLLLAQTAVVVVVAVKTVGVVLVSSFVVIPAATARLIGTSLAQATWIALVISTLGAAVGLVASYHLDTPAAATIILIHCAGFAGALVWSRLR